VSYLSIVFCDLSSNERHMPCRDPYKNSIPSILIEPPNHVCRRKSDRSNAVVTLEIGKSGPGANGTFGF